MGLQHMVDSAVLHAYIALLNFFGQGPTNSAFFVEAISKKSYGIASKEKHHVRH